MLFYVLSWFGLVVLAILNGTIRVKGYAQFTSELTAHQLSTLILVVLMGIYIYILTGVFPLDSSQQALLIGGIWLVMTVMFEFIFGHYVMGNAWSVLFHDYNVFEGRVWLIVLVWALLAPYVMYQLRSY
ncbi:hypothetical protein FE785_07960 [Thiomicrorhabdus sediminis]|uniref:Uncharacterized protein n=2 Tax=Thiomicrorhabdus sediminis TaxID=2580412 RepID=A0A4P9K9L3_9GAMM|nr:hypothetical protein FE785_07960 [Thiomicrorhabdus sediminis]